jgi:hypothetical protein
MILPGTDSKLVADPGRVQEITLMEKFGDGWTACEISVAVYAMHRLKIKIK